jgi:hypothetical protein
MSKMMETDKGRRLNDSDAKKKLEENKGETRFKEMQQKPLCGQNFKSLIICLLSY